MAERYSDNSRLVAVDVKGLTIKYGFRTTLGSAASISLGQTTAVDPQGALLSGVILGANSPKPPRASKRRASGETDSSFISYSAIATAKTAGWSVKAGRLTIPRSTKISFPVFAVIDSGTTTNGAGETVGINYKYGWRMPKYQYDLINGNFAALGITLVTNDNYSDVWFGVNSPKPKRVGFNVNANSVLSTYASTAKLDSLPEGWFQITTKATSTGFGI